MTMYVRVRATLDLRQHQGDGNIYGVHQRILCVRSAKFVPDLRAHSATAKQRLFAVSDFYYKLGRHRENDYGRETEVNSHVSESSEDNRYLESKGGEEIVQNHSQQRNQTGSCATALTVRTEEEKKPAPSRKRYGEKLISRPESGDPAYAYLNPGTKGMAKKTSSGEVSGRESGRRTNFLSSLFRFTGSLKW